MPRSAVAKAQGQSKILPNLPQASTSNCFWRWRLPLSKIQDEEKAIARSLARVPHKITATFSPSLPSWLLFSPPQRKWINIQSLSSNVEKMMSHATQHRGAARRKTHSHKKKDDDGALEALFPSLSVFPSRGRRNDKTFLVFRRQASHSILSNFIRERRRTRSYIGRKDIVLLLQGAAKG